MSSEEILFTPSEFTELKLLWQSCHNLQKIFLVWKKYGTPNPLKGPEDPFKFVELLR